jgi:hypothetical protein
MRLVALGCLVVGACGDKPVTQAAPEPTAKTREHNYPLQQWMTSNFTRAVKAENFEVLAQGLSVAARNAPAGLGAWTVIAEAGARAATARDIEGVRQSCSTCHEKYRAVYRQTLRARPYPMEP